MPVTALAADGYGYVDANGDLQTTGTTTVTVLSGTGAGETLSSGWYIVLDPDVMRSSVITVNGDVHLILADGASLTVVGGSIYDEPGFKVEDTNSLTVYGQSAGTGALIATGDFRGAGIGSGNQKNSGIITINGGTITAQGGYYAAGIGGGIADIDTTSEAITINGGVIYATGGDRAAGIGAGDWGDAGVITITGGTVYANGGTLAAGIGGGYCGNGGTVYISGGSVKAAGKNGSQDIGYGTEGSGGMLQNNSVDQTPVYLTTVTLEDDSGSPVGSSAIASLTASCAYGTKDMKTDTDGKLYLYLPAAAHTTAAYTEGLFWPFQAMQRQLQAAAAVRLPCLLL